jgi:type IV pilus assembly protein PilC
MLTAVEKNKTHKNDHTEQTQTKNRTETHHGAHLKKAAALSNVHVKSSEIILFTTQLAVMLDSGVVLSDAIDAIAAQMQCLKFKNILQNISETVKEGETFSSALKIYPKVFGSIYISIVKASEASGKMTQMLEVLANYLEFESQTRKKIKGALTYPFIMALMAVAASGTLMFFVLPRFMKIYEAKGQQLPKLTQFLVSCSKTISDPEKMTIIISSLTAIGFAIYFWYQTQSGQKFFDWLKLHIPVVGTMFIDTVITRSTRIMATMLNTGVGLLETLEIVEQSCDNYYFTSLWNRCNDRIRDGYQLSESIQLADEANIIAPGITQMFRAGEKSGKLGTVADKISIFYGKKLENSIQSVMAMIEPLMITVLGAIIGTLAIGLLLPVFKISSVIAH